MQLIFDDQSLSASTSSRCFLKDAVIDPSILPGHAQKAAEIPLVVLFQAFEVSSVRRAGIRAIKE